LINILLRGIIVYIIVIVSVRLMGKRQIGELQPTELVTTFLLSEIASMPLQNKDISLATCVVLIFMIVGLEIIFSVLSMKSRLFRTVTQGSGALIIKDGKLLQNKLSQIRYSIDDLLEALRLKDVFDISEVKYAYVETNGSLSVMLKDSAKPVTKADLKLPQKSTPLTCLVISDGKITDKDFDLCALTEEKLLKELSKKNISAADVFLMTADKNGRFNIIRKEQIK